ncbi:MAG TPA: lipoate--protein ligase family protein [Longimicrobiales bacterium]|nr:lipoate--protein ligase family protein [Longimicrobiales bacterium]
MAVDHALLESVQAGGRPVLRLYRWDPACLSLGRNQHARGLYDEARLRETGIDIVRRPTGGLAVLHHLELTYCVLAPVSVLGGPRAAYRAINGALVDGLRRLGVPAGLAAGGAGRDPRRAAAEPCFHAPADGEVVAGGRKLVGSAQRCEGATLLQHGSILLAGSQSTVLGLLRGGPAPAGPEQVAGSVTMEEILGAVPGWDEMVAALTSGFGRTLGTRLAPDALNHEEAVRAEALEATYRDAAWTWRR